MRPVNAASSDSSAGRQAADSDCCNMTLATLFPLISAPHFDAHGKTPAELWAGDSNGSEGRLSRAYSKAKMEKAPG